MLGLSPGPAAAGGEIGVFSTPADSAIVGSSYEAAQKFGHLANWEARIRPANAEIVPDKGLMDARVRDMGRNEGTFAGIVKLSKDHIVGQQYLLNAKPNSAVLFGRDDEEWETAFSEEVESKFMLWAESPNNWPDASRQNSLYGQIRLALTSYVLSGEVLASSEWMPDDGRPFRSAMLMLDPDRLCNPNGNNFAPNIVGGVERDRRGAPIAYHILDRHPGEPRGSKQWRRVMARKPSGRPYILHIFEQQRPDQARGISALVSALSSLKMLSEFRKVELQRAVVAATYAATIESDLPSGDIWTAMGADAENQPLETYLSTYLGAAAELNDASKHLRIDGVRIPTLMPGSKLNIQHPGAASPLGADFETSMLRHVAAALGVSYEQLSRDFSKTNYSSGKAAMGETERHLAAQKKQVADRTASFLYRLWLEEAYETGQIEALKRRQIGPFYSGLTTDALASCEWIGAGRGQVDELKETQAAMLRLRGGLSTYEDEIARIHGADWRKLIKQRLREKTILEKLDLPSAYTIEETDAENAASGEPREASNE